ncbi:MAG: hypothetical protein GXP55_18570 [Deltaproteobacteria bacterium]|nr:hypothetical protein [Deltaproteobacteria bacterium]
MADLSSFDLPSDDRPLGSLRPPPRADWPGSVAGECTLLSRLPGRVWPGRGPSIVRAVGDTLLVAGYAQGPRGMQVYALRVLPDGRSQPLFSADLTASRLPRVPPGLATRGARALLAWVDGGRLRAIRLSLAASAGGGGRTLELGRGADPRFSPAVSLQPRAVLVAYTDGSATPMHVRLLRLGLEDEIEARADVSLPHHGAAAPSFARGGQAASPRLYFLEPRSGISALYAVDFASDLSPRPARLVRPISSTYEPPRIAVASSPGVVAYTALGSAATTAIGLLPLDDANRAPVALLRGSGFGLFGLDVALLPGAAVFAFGAPTHPSSPSPGPANRAPHEIHVRLAAPAPLPELVIRSAGGAESPSIAAGPGGLFALTYAASGGVYLRWLRCAPP